MSKKKDPNSWRGMGEAYKNAKKTPILNEDDYISSKRKKKKKKVKRSEHKHIYIPAIYHRSCLRSDGHKDEWICCGSHCKICGKVKNMNILWSRPEERLERFKEEYPKAVEITVPETWDWFRDKCIPV